jgi:hypothetical protein
LRRAATFLRKIGIKIDYTREGNARTRIIHITATGISPVPDYRGVRPSASSASSAGISKGNENNGVADSTAQTVARTVAGSADGQADDGNTASGSTVRANPLKTNDMDGADGADANFPSQSGSEKGVDDMELPEGDGARITRGAI